MIPGLITAALLVLFVVGCVWLWLPSHKPAMDAAAHMPLEDEREGAA